ncbi:MAG: hypothetical protein R8G33_02575 [Gammaproteobacteria bacterium]|nr:hypothetical protein [Gammaproteobacteria bacterium]
MRILDVDTDRAVLQAQLYFTENEARQLVTDLQSLLADPDSIKHHHLFSDDSGCEISYSLITPTKLENISSYTSREQKLLSKHK